jgi:hypothetical protein
MTENGHRPQPPGAASSYPGAPSGVTPAYPGAPPGVTPAYPGAPPSAPSFTDEIHSAVEYERGLAVKALLSIALVALVLVLRVAFFG